MKRRYRNNIYKKNMNVIEKFLIYSYIILLPIGTGLSGIIGNISLLNYISLGIIISGIFYIIKERSIKINKKAIPTFLYFLYTIFSCLWSSNIKFNWYVATNIMNFLLLFVLNIYSWNKERIEKLFKCFYISQLVVIFAILKNLSSMKSYRLHITIISTIGISDFVCGLCLLNSFWMVTYIKERKIKKICAFLFLIINATAIFMAGSRGALMMFIGMFIIFIFSGNFSKKRKIIIILGMIIIGLLGIGYFADFLPKTVTNRMTLEAVKESHGSGRYNIWRLALEKFLESNYIRICFGYGFDSFKNTIAYGSHGGFENLMAHNMVVQTMIEGGLIGIILLFFMIWSQFKIACRKKDNIMQIALVGLFIASLSIDMQVTRIFGFILTFNLMRNSRRLFRKKWNRKKISE